MDKRLRFYAITIGVAFIVAIVANFYPVSSSSSEVNRPIYTPQALARMLNRERVKVGVAPIQLDERLNESALFKAQDMVNNNYYEHANPATGKQGFEIAHDYLNTCSATSENIDQGGDTNNYDPIASWMTSPAHKDAQLDSKYNRVGFSGVKGSDGKYYYVAHFCTLSSRPTTQEVSLNTCPVTTCNDDSCSDSVGSGTCSHHDGVNHY